MSGPGAMPAMPRLVAARGRPMPCRPWNRHALAPPDWRDLAAALAAGPEGSATDVLGLWADRDWIHALFGDRDGPFAASVPVEARRYVSLSRHGPVAARFERMVYDLWGFEAVEGHGSAVEAPLLDHGHWALHHPMAAQPLAAMPAVGPAPGTAPPADGIGHRGIPALCRGQTPAAAARFVARCQGARSVAHALAFAGAVEAAMGVVVPPRARALRRTMLAAENLAASLWDAHRVAVAVGHPRPAALYLDTLETLRRATGAAFGHRLMLDAVVPGGVAAAPDDAALAAIGRLAAAAMPALGRSLFGLERAAAAWRDAFPAVPAAPMPGMMGMAAALVASLPPSVAPPAGDAAMALPARDGEAFGEAGSAAGPVRCWVRLDGGLVAACLPIDPDWLVPGGSGLAPGGEPAPSGWAAEPAGAGRDL